MNFDILLSLLIHPASIKKNGMFIFNIDNFEYLDSALSNTYYECYTEGCLNVFWRPIFKFGHPVVFVIYITYIVSTYKQFEHLHVVFKFSANFQQILPNRG